MRGTSQVVFNKSNISKKTTNVGEMKVKKVMSIGRARLVGGANT